MADLVGFDGTETIEARTEEPKRREASTQEELPTSLERAGAKPREQSAGNDEARENMLTWVLGVGPAEADAELAAQRGDEGYSTKYATTRRAGTPPPILVTPKSPPSEDSEISTPEPGSKQHDKSDIVRASQHRGAKGDDLDGRAGHDINNRKDDRDSGTDNDQNEDDDSDDSSDSGSGVASSSTADSELPNDGTLLDLVRNSGWWKPAMLELSKQRTIRSRVDWKNEKIKPAILRCSKKAEECHKIVKQGNKIIAKQ
ncbi:MAG: hypothetical protein Q9169_007423 [Polycauliona sp. 2 TL-2023]